MTTSPVVSVTDELVAELEQYSGVPSIASLLDERAELKRDVKRYQWLRDNWFQIYGESRGSSGIKISIGDIWNHAGCADHVDAAIDAAMQSKP